MVVDLEILPVFSLMFFYIRGPGSAAIEDTHAENLLTVEVGDKGIVVLDNQSQFVDILRLRYVE